MLDTIFEKVVDVVILVALVISISLIEFPERILFLKVNADYHPFMKR